MKLVYHFGQGHADGDGSMRDVLGGKGASLADMARIGLPVPPGFTIPTSVCRYFLSHRETLPDGLQVQVLQGLAKIESSVGRRFGDRQSPLLLAVRSGASVSMPGMMDSILNVGLNNYTVEGLVEQTRDPCFAYDSYRRVIHMYGHVVFGIPNEVFTYLSTDAAEEPGTTAYYERLVGDYLRVVQAHTGQEFPQDPYEQLWGSISAILRSWNNRRAAEYRRIHEISATLGTACTVQGMVFGNLGDDSATGVAFTRDPVNGDREIYGEYLPKAQGEDVVAGGRTPFPIIAQTAALHAQDSLQVTLPQCYDELRAMRKRLERHYREMQDIEFTIEAGKVWLLQSRAGKRTANAAVRIAVDMVSEEIITKSDALQRVDASRLEELLHHQLDTSDAPTPIAQSLAASPGGAVGRIVLNADDAVARSARGEAVILVRSETSPDDIHGMYAAEGLLTARGGLTSHAAVVARGMGKPCVAGCASIAIDLEARCVNIGKTTLREGDWISIDGAQGAVYAGELPLRRPNPATEFHTLMSWADDARTLQVRTNVDTARDASIALELGAEGIGLARTEHMFFDTGRIEFMQDMILADDDLARQRALDSLLPLQRSDFRALLRVMRGRPVTIRLLDPPLHEFLPRNDAACEQLAERLGQPVDDIVARVRRVREHNPMLGHRGCRLGLTYPEIYQMQARAMFEAAADLLRDDDITSALEIEVPLVSHVNELRQVRELVADVARTVEAQTGLTLAYKLGAMLELPRACMTADALAECADFLSFGTNDLTQTCYGLSRDDAARFLQTYVQKEILPENPFAHIDADGVGGLMLLAVERARRVKPQIPIGICGEHAGDPASIRFCHNLGLQYVSCSPYRIPVARLAAAQAAVGI